MEFKIHEVQWTDAKVKRFWDFFNNYRSFENLWFSKTVGKGIIRLVNTYFPLKGKVLDYGIGKGHFTEYLLKNKSLELYACDFSLETVTNINNLFKDETNFKECSLVERFPSGYHDNEFDIVFLIEAIEHFTDDYLLPTINEVQRILKPGGKFIVTTPNKENLPEQHVICPDCGGVFHRVQHVRSFSKESLTSIINSNGFTTIFCDATDFYQFGTNGFAYKIRNSFKKMLQTNYKAPHLLYIGEKRKE
ncbi:MAG TPA: methyltransferase domain-containing protein [Flavitalea sp.]|nr:methyltransferase domain-containing protein [Flavitalea sp.]